MPIDPKTNLPKRFRYYDRSQHFADVNAWIGNDDPDIASLYAVTDNELVDTLTVCDALGIWPVKDETISVETALTCWRIIEKLRVDQTFPTKLKV